MNYGILRNFANHVNFYASHARVIGVAATFRWSYIAGTLLCGIGVIGLLAGLRELIKYLNGEK